MLNASDATTALKSWCDERGIEDGVDEFLAFLSEKKARYVLPQLLKELTHAAAEEKKRTTAQLTTDRKLTPEQTKQLSEALDGEKAQESVTDDLIAGANLQQAGRQFDASIKGRLQTLKNHLRISHE